MQLRKKAYYENMPRAESRVIHGAKVVGSPSHAPSLLPTLDNGPPRQPRALARTNTADAIHLTHTVKNISENFRFSSVIHLPE